jgi:hypothetical protein
MPTRVYIAYGLIALMVIAAAVGLAVMRQKRLEDRHIRHGRPRKPPPPRHRR